jgi:hypothetical protein
MSAVFMNTDPNTYIERRIARADRRVEVRWPVVDERREAARREGDRDAARAAVLPTDGQRMAAIWGLSPLVPLKPEESLVDAIDDIWNDEPESASVHPAPGVMAGRE